MINDHVIFCTICKSLKLITALIWCVHCIDTGQMQRVTDNVKARYQRKGLATSSSTWPPFHAQSFTNLALVHQKITQLQGKKDTTKIARVRTKGDIHKIPELTSSIKLNGIHQIFTPIASDVQTQCPMSILIEGHPGIGKTTLVKEMRLQWANDQLLTSDKLVLLLMLRDPNVQKITSIEQLVKYTQLTDCVLSYLQNTNGAGVTLIIDGFDELSTELRQTSFFRKLIEGDVLYNARIVVTSRPSASACLHQCVHRRIEVLGFEKSSKEKYVDNVLKDTPECLHKLKAHFQQYPNIDALCYIPLNMAIIVYLCLLGSLPPTATKMYETFILHTICRHLKRVETIPNDTSVTQMDKLPQSVCEVLQQLQKVAFDGLIKDKIVFTVEELPVLCKDDLTCYGLLQSTECYSAEEIGTPTQSFNFLHLGIQEYFAAKYVTTLPEDEVYTLLKESFIVKYSYPPDPDSKSVRLSNMWILYCGITSGQCKTLRHYLSTYGKPSQQEATCSQGISDDEPFSLDILWEQVKVLSLFQCFQEAQDKELCRVLSNNIDVINMDYHSLLPYQVVSLGFFLSKSHKKWWLLNLDGCYIGDHGMNIIHQYLKLCGDEVNKQEITKIYLNWNDLTGASSHLIADIISTFHTRVLHMKFNKITCTSQEAVAISDMMICLEQLDISCNELGDHGAELLSEGITNTKTLRVLNIDYNNIGPSGTTAIANALTNNTSLKELHLNGDFGRNGAIALGDAITNNKKLKILSLSSDLPITGGYAMDKESAKIIIRSLDKNNTVAELYLDIVLHENHIVELTREVEKINSMRKSDNEHIKFNLNFYDIEDDAKDYVLHEDTINDFVPMEILQLLSSYG